MKSIYIVLTIITLINYKAKAQYPPIEAGAVPVNIANVNPTLNIADAYHIIPINQNSIQTITNTEKVSGEPFFINQWTKGIIILDNGLVYKNYLLKYNTYNQTVLFLSGKESMETDQKIKEFILMINEGEEIHFLHASNFHLKQNNFYEVLRDVKEGQLLQLNKKAVKSISEKLTDLNEVKAFEKQPEYFIFDKGLNKFTSYKKAAPALKALFNLNSD